MSRRLCANSALLQANSDLLKEMLMPPFQVGSNLKGRMLKLVAYVQLKGERWLKTEAVSFNCVITTVSGACI